MEWEIDRHSWKEFGEGAQALPIWIEELVSTQDAGRADDLVRSIEAVVAPVSGPLTAGASASAACLVQGLLTATPIARVEVLHLIFQLIGSAISNPIVEFAEDVKQEIKLGLPIFCEIAETGTRAGRLQCVDLLSLCARIDDQSLSRAVAVMRRVASLGDRKPPLSLSN